MNIFAFQSREVDRTKRTQVKEANRYFFIETSIALFVSFLINMFVVAVFAHGMWDNNKKRTNADILEECRQNNNSHSDIFPVSYSKYVSPDTN
jgi:NRAMP (natural resistance-associated macrophage protein)-like metal ion transporter